MPNPSYDEGRQNAHARAYRSASSESLTRPSALTDGWTSVGDVPRDHPELRVGEGRHHVLDERLGEHPPSFAALPRADEQHHRVSGAGSVGGRRLQADPVGNDGRDPGRPPTGRRRDEDAPVGDQARQHLAEPEQHHPRALHDPPDVDRLLEARAVEGADVGTDPTAPHPVVVAMGVQDVVAGQVRASQLGREPEGAQAAAGTYQPVAVAGAGHRRARAEHRDVVTPLGQLRRQGVDLVAHSDLALAGQVVRDHRDAQRSVTGHGGAPRGAPAASRGRTPGPARGGCPRPTRSTT